MKSFLLPLLFLAVFCFGAPAARALDAQARDEIEYLLRQVESSDSRFIRNGTEYSAKEGAAHLRDKLKGAGDRIKTADDFVAGAATKSMISGQPYLMKPAGGAPIPVGPWLKERLTKYRTTKRAEVK